MNRRKREAKLMRIRAPSIRAEDLEKAEARIAKLERRIAELESQVSRIELVTGTGNLALVKPRKR